MPRLIRARIDLDIRSSLGSERKNLWLRLNHTPVGTLQTDYRGRCVDKNIFFSQQRINLRKRES